MLHTEPTTTKNQPVLVDADSTRTTRGLRRLTGWCGLGMVLAIVVNGPLSMALQRTPSYWEPGAADAVAKHLTNPGNVDRMALFFALSNLIFVFAIGFLAGLRRIADDSDPSGWVKGVVSIGGGLFLAGGLLSETLSTGIAVVLRSTPDYQLDANNALLLQGLWSTAIAQGQVALGVVVVAVSGASLRRGHLPQWLAWFGIVAGLIAILRPGIIAHVPLFIVSFQPMFLWIAAISIVLLRKTTDEPTRRVT